jgi:hypothetical protein
MNHKIIMGERKHIKGKAHLGFHIYKVPENYKYSKVMKKNPWLSGDRVEKWGAGRDYKAVRAKLG